MTKVNEERLRKIAANGLTFPTVSDFTETEIAIIWAVDEIDHLKEKLDELQHKNSLIDREIISLD